MKKFIWLAGVWLAGVARGAVWFVDCGSAGGDGSEGAPFASIQEGINAAAAGDEVRVASGSAEEPKVYAIDFPVTNVPGRAVSVVAESADPRATVIDGQGKTNCVHLTTASLFAGFTVTNGTYGVSGGSICGAGIILNPGTAALATVSNCVVRNCIVSVNEDGKSAHGGGGVCQSW